MNPQKNVLVCPPGLTGDIFGPYVTWQQSRQGKVSGIELQFEAVECRVRLKTRSGILYIIDETCVEYVYV